MRGIVQVPRVPPYMKPSALRRRLEVFGKIERLFLRQEDPQQRQRRIKSGGNRRVNYTEGYVEFEDKRVAKRVALSLNGTPMGGKKGARVSAEGGSSMADGCSRPTTFVTIVVVVVSAVVICWVFSSLPDSLLRVPIVFISCTICR